MLRQVELYTKHLITKITLVLLEMLAQVRRNDTQPVLAQVFLLEAKLMATQRASCHFH